MSDTFPPPRPAMPVVTHEPPRQSEREMPNRSCAHDPPRLDDIPEAGEDFFKKAKLIRPDELGAPKVDKRGRRVAGKPKRKTRPKLPSRKAGNYRNRPKEARDQLHAVLAVTGTLRGSEMLQFTNIVQQLAGMTRGARRRIIEALAQVYP